MPHAAGPGQPPRGREGERAGIYVAGRSPGWGIGSHAFVAGGVGRIRSDLGGGSRYFAEGGGGVTSGPIGVELSVKFAWNRLSEPVEHKFMTVPVSLRATLTGSVLRFLRLWRSPKPVWMTPSPF